MMWAHSAQQEELSITVDSLDYAIGASPQQRIKDERNLFPQLKNTALTIDHKHCHKKI